MKILRLFILQSLILKIFILKNSLQNTDFLLCPKGARGTAQQPRQDSNEKMVLALCALFARRTVFAKHELC
jgi:hypothetical protein